MNVDRWVLPADDVSAARARALVRHFLERCDDRHVDVESALLLVSELVSNAVRHGDGGAAPLVLRVELSEAGLHIAVEDSDPRPPCLDAEAAESDEAEHGRGLLIVDRVSAAWGWNSEPRGPGAKEVWCDVPARPKARNGG